MILKRGPDDRRSAPPRSSKFTLSARGKDPQLPILRYLAREFPHIAIAQVESIFGFVERCTLYGGRPFGAPELSARDVAVIYECGMGLRLPLSNHHVAREEYERNRAFLARYHRKGNSVITTSEQLAAWIGDEFPAFEIEASVIKEIDTAEKIAEALEIYDTVVIPMRLNLDLEFLERAAPKARITLFANAGCALTCPSKICYPSFSQANKFTGKKTMCSFSLRPRELYGMLDFDLDKLAAMGFQRFKMLRSRDHGLTGY
ncbi:MAG: hypothetical protein HYU52_14405 [Acidobacteria bacterium]|nr:hypothetical protein [Acidobacteriota bacterium]